MRKQATLFVRNDGFSLMQHRNKRRTTQPSRDLNVLIDHLPRAMRGNRWQLVVDDSWCLQQRIHCDTPLNEKNAYAFARLQAHNHFGIASNDLLIDCLPLATSAFALWICACQRQRIEPIQQLCSPKLGQLTALSPLSLYTLTNWARQLKHTRITTLAHVSSTQAIVAQHNHHAWLDIQTVTTQQLAHTIAQREVDSPYVLINHDQASNGICEQTLLSINNGHWLQPWHAHP